MSNGLFAFKLGAVSVRQQPLDFCLLHWALSHCANYEVLCIPVCSLCCTVSEWFKHLFHTLIFLITYWRILLILPSWRTIRAFKWIVLLPELYVVFPRCKLVRRTRARKKASVCVSRFAATFMSFFRVQSYDCLWNLQAFLSAVCVNSMYFWL